MNILKQVAILLTFLVVASSVNAQVTIGSNFRPNEGALLDLKEKTDGLSSKGVGLPRVHLVKLKGDLGETMNVGTGKYDNTEHVGMIVYNVNKCANETKDAHGIFVWTETEWEPLNIIKYSTVRGISGRVYRTATFGEAGEWMIDNLAETTYEPNISGVISEGYNPSASMTAKEYYYPTNATGYTGNPVDDSKFYNMYKDQNIGLLYTWAAATNGSYCDEYNSAGKPAKPTNIIQGICPDSWYLPSDYDWGELEKEMAGKPQLYSSVTSPTPFDEITTNGYWKNSGISSWYGKHAVAMKSECAVPASNQATNGKSSHQGFNILLVGFVRNGKPEKYGEHSFFWASTSIASPSKAWYRGYQNNRESSGRGSAYDRANLHSVRCKKR